MAKVTIDDISRHTRLSRGTVSRALNDRPDISAQTKARVLEACRKLNYLPSHAARSLATGRSFAVAVLVADLQSVFAASFLRGALARAQTARYAVHVAELGADAEQSHEVIRTVVGERIDGLLVATPLAGGLVPGLRDALQERPLVACSPIDELNCDLLIPDHTEAGRLVARHLIRDGDRRLLYIHAPRPGAAERLAGFHEVCQEHGLDPAALTVELPANRPINPHTADLITVRLPHVSAIAASDDFLAIDVMALCQRAGRQPGRDIAVIGHGNERVGAWITPTLSTTDFCGEEIGRRAMETALQRLGQTRRDAPQTAHVSPLLVARESTRMLA